MEKQRDGPEKLWEEANIVEERLEQRFGPLKDIGTPLFEEGGQLWGKCSQMGLSRSVSNKVHQS